MELGEPRDQPASKRPRLGLANLARPANSFHKLLRRELSQQGNLQFKRNSAKEKFRHLALCHQFDPYQDVPSFPLAFLRRRSRITEIVAAEGVIFALAHSGVCAAYERRTNKLICYLNSGEDEVVRSLFYNKNNHSIITVSVYAHENYSSLKCRSTPIAAILARDFQDKGIPLFQTESLRWPGFVEFDDVNGKVLTFNAQAKIYKVFDLKNYQELYQITDKNVQEIKISPGIMLLIFNSVADGKEVPLQIRSIDDGKVLRTFSHEITPSLKIDFIEQFNEKLLVKQENTNLKIRDVRTEGQVVVPVSQFITPSAFIFLYENQLFLTFRKGNVEVWDFRGNLVTTFEDHMLWHNDCNTNNIYITSEQDVIISYCKATKASTDAAAAGSINISNILTGHSIAKLTKESDGTINALTDVTALFYDEEHNEIYTGNKDGYVHIWANGGGAVGGLDGDGAAK